MIRSLSGWDTERLVVGWGALPRWEGVRIALGAVLHYGAQKEPMV